MEIDNLQEEIVVDEGRNHHTILNFQDFILKEGKKGKDETKKNRPKIKNREEYTDDEGDDIIDPNDNPERFIKLREQFIKEELQ